MIVGDPLCDVSNLPVSRSFDLSPTVREEGCPLCSF